LLSALFNEERREGRMTDQWISFHDFRTAHRIPPAFMLHSDS
jgi:hypothetical protein